MSKGLLGREYGHRLAVNELLAHGYEPEYLPEIDFYTLNHENDNEDLPYIEGHYTTLKLKEKKILKEAEQIQRELHKIKENVEEDPKNIEKLTKSYVEKLKEIEKLKEEYKNQKPIIPDRYIPITQRLGKYMFEETEDNLIGDGEEWREATSPDYEGAQRSVIVSDNIHGAELDICYEVKNKNLKDDTINISGRNLLKMAFIANGDTPLRKEPQLGCALMGLRALIKSLPDWEWRAIDKTENTENKSFEESTELYKLDKASKTPLTVIALEVIEKCLQNKKLFNMEPKDARIGASRLEEAIKVGQYIRNFDTIQKIIEANNQDPNKEPNKKQIDDVYKQLDTEKKKEFLQRINDSCKLIQKDLERGPYRYRMETDPKGHLKNFITIAGYNDHLGHLIKDASIRKLVLGDSGSPMFEKVYKDGPIIEEPKPEPGEKEEPKKGLKRALSRLKEALSLESI